MNPLAQAASASTSSLVPVVFCGTTLFLVEHNDEPFVPMKPVVEGMGMSWPTQLKKLNSTPRWGVSIIAIPSESGAQETSCLPLRKLPGWLNSIHPNKVAPSIRPKVIAYQNECDDVLWKFWNGQRQELPTKPQITRLPARFIAKSDGVTITELFAVDENAVCLSPDSIGELVGNKNQDNVRQIIIDALTPPPLSRNSCPSLIGFVTECGDVAWKKWPDNLRVIPDEAIADLVGDKDKFFDATLIPALLNACVSRLTGAPYGD